MTAKLLKFAYAMAILFHLFIVGLLGYRATTLFLEGKKEVGLLTVMVGALLLTAFLWNIALNKWRSRALKAEAQVRKLKETA